MKPFFVLLAEDNADLRGLFEFLLLSDGFEVKAVEDGEEALDVLAKRRPDAVVTDLNMPNMGGLELIEWIRSQEGMQGLPVIALTAYGENMLMRAKRAGASRVMAKPTDSQLCYELNSLLLETPLTW